VTAPRRRFSIQIVDAKGVLLLANRASWTENER
jgi:hypothetical protein